MNRSPFQRQALLTALALACVAFTACGGDDPAPASPTAEIRFYHAASTLGTIEVTIGDETVQLTPDDLSSIIEVDPGSISVSVGNAGAVQSLYEFTDTVDEGEHVFVISDASGDLDAFEVGLDAPEPEPGEAVFQVVSLVSVALEFDVYADVTAQPQTVARAGQTTFFSADPAEAGFFVYNEGNDPSTSAALLSLDNDDLSFEAGGTYAVLLSGDLTGLDFIVAELR